MDNWSLQKIKAMRTNNLFNRIFHKKELAELKKQALIYKQQIECGARLLDNILKCDSLTDLVELHKLAWANGYRNENLAPCSYGMIRTNSIETLTPNEVFLGGIWGLNTHSIPFWESHKGDAYGANGFGIDPTYDLYTMILNQYKGLVESNVQSLYNKAVKEYPKYKQYVQKQI